MFFILLLVKTNYFKNKNIYKCCIIEIYNFNNIKKNYIISKINNILYKFLKIEFRKINFYKLF